MRAQAVAATAKGKHRGERTKASARARARARKKGRAQSHAHTREEMWCLLNTRVVQRQGICIVLHTYVFLDLGLLSLDVDSRRAGHMYSVFHRYSVSLVCSGPRILCLTSLVSHATFMSFLAEFAGGFSDMCSVRGVVCLEDAGGAHRVEHVYSVAHMLCLTSMLSHSVAHMLCVTNMLSHLCRVLHASGLFHIYNVWGVVCLRNAPWAHRVEDIFSVAHILCAQVCCHSVAHMLCRTSMLSHLCRVLHAIGFSGICDVWGVVCGVWCVGCGVSSG